jgi:ribulose-5-phosphate 4-epimerase/fuculose-1-phosphate aldolase
MPVSERDLRQQIIAVAQICECRDLLIYTQGNFSARRPGTPDQVLITPSDVPYPGMQPDDLVVVNLEGQKLEGKHQPSSETPIHTTAYRRFPQVGACAHVESPYVNALYALGIEIPPILGNFVYLFAGKGLAVGPSIKSASRDFAEKTLDAMGDRFGVVWKNHGMFCVGPDIHTALKRCLAAEQSARVYWLALSLGKGEPDLVPAGVQQEMIEAVAALGWTKAI